MEGNQDRYIGKYDYNDKEDYIEKQKYKFFNKLSVAQEVERFLLDKTWKSIIEPIIDKMITDTVGGKVRGRWVGGALTNAKRDEEKEFYLGYKQFGIDLLTRIYSYADNIKKLESQIVTLDEELNAPMMPPMLERQLPMSVNETIPTKKEVMGVPCRGKKSKKKAKKMKGKREK